MNGWAAQGCTRLGHACQTVLACRAYAALLEDGVTGRPAGQDDRRPVDDAR